jgi:putative NADPH-quinone reductase
LPPSTSTHPLILLGSARSESDTGRLIKQLFEPHQLQLLDLLDYPLHHYSYSGQYPADDAFGAIVQQLLAHPLIIFATPVYWYSMSSRMKVLFDRLTDLVTHQKHIGRQLKGKKMALLAVGNSDTLPEGFEIPFQETAAYLDMHYLGSYYCPASRVNSLRPAEVALLQKLQQA